MRGDVSERERGRDIREKRKIEREGREKARKSTYARERREIP